MSKASDRIVDAAQVKGLAVQEKADHYAIQCPVHADGNPSLMVRGIPGSVLMYCFAGCATADVVDALGLEMTDLFDEPRGTDYVYPGGRIVTRTPEKNFYQSGDKTDQSLFGSDRINGDVVYVTEGEKDVLAIESAGGHAVSPPNGANSKPQRYDWSPLRGKDVRIVTDRDAVGKKHADEVARHLAEIAATVAIFEPVEGKDAADHIAAGRGLNEFRALTPPDVITLSQAFDTWREWRDSEGVDPIPTPWSALNAKLAGGLHPGRVYVLGARTGEGKSVAGQNMVSHAVLYHHPSLVVSVEMPVVEVVSRIIAAQAGVDYGDITKRDFGAISTRVDEYIMKHRHLPMYFCDNPSVTIEEVGHKCRALKANNKLSLVFLDYAQLITASDRRVSRQEQVAHIVRQAKVLAMELNIVVILAAQLNRDSEGEENGQPVVPKRKDLRESGELEQSADVILLLHRSKVNDCMYVSIAKNRTGPESTVQLRARFDQARISS